MAKFTDTLSLVKLQGEYFPLAEADYRLLRERNVSVFRITEDTLNILSSALLKGVKIEQHPWGKVYPKLLESFKQSLLSKATSDDAFGFKEETKTIIVMTDTSNPKTADSNKNECSQAANQLAEFMGRYGIRTKTDTKQKDGYSLTRLSFSLDENIVPSFYFGCKDDYNAPLFLDFNLSPVAKLKFSKRLSLNGSPTFSVTFEDRFGDHYEESFVRGFPFKDLLVKDCEAAIEFFVNLHSRLTIKPKKK